MALMATIGGAAIPLALSSVDRTRAAAPPTTSRAADDRSFRGGEALDVCRPAVCAAARRLSDAPTSTATAMACSRGTLRAVWIARSAPPNSSNSSSAGEFGICAGVTGSCRVHSTPPILFRSASRAAEFQPCNGSSTPGRGLSVAVVATSSPYGTWCHRTDPYLGSLRRRHMAAR